MIIARRGDRLRLVTQSDHAHLAGEILSLWRADDLPDHPHRPELLFAAREHDNGWREADAAPRVDPASGRPLDFRAMPREPRFEIWRRGTTRWAAERPRAALLITHHALVLHESHEGEEEWEELLGPLRELRAELLEETAVEAEELASDYRLLDLADLLSLVLSNDWREPFERNGYRGRLEAGDTAGNEDRPGSPAVLRLDPFPLAGTTSFRLPCRHVTDRPYRGEVDLGVELATARWEREPVRLAPFPE